jgi:hypothetical protein
VQEKPERRRGSVGGHFGGGPCNEEVARYNLHCKPPYPFLPPIAVVQVWYSRRDSCVQLYIGLFKVSLATLALSTSMTFARAPGNIIDWVYKRTGVKYSFAAHLRDTGTVSCFVRPRNIGSFFFPFYLKYGFALPEQWIRPVGEETAKMTEYLADFITGKECR